MNKTLEQNPLDDNWPRQNRGIKISDECVCDESIYNLHLLLSQLLSIKDK